MDRVFELFVTIDTLPESSLLGATRASRTAEVERALDGLVGLLRRGPAVDVRVRYAELSAQLVEAEERVARLREAHRGAPSRGELNRLRQLTTRSREDLLAQLEEQRAQAEVLRAQLDGLRATFVEEVGRIGLQVAPDQAEVLLHPVAENDVVAIAAVLLNVLRIGEQLRALTDASGEAPDATRRYYGFHVLLVWAIDRMQHSFVHDVRERVFPKLAALEGEARALIGEAEKFIDSGGDRAVLAANVEANQLTVEACALLRQELEVQVAMVMEENVKVTGTRATALHTYRTVKLANEAVGLLQTSRDAVAALRSVQVPPPRPFQNAALKRETLRLRARLGQ